MDEPTTIICEAAAKSSHTVQFTLRSVLTWTAISGIYLVFLQCFVSFAQHGNASGHYFPFRVLPDSIAEPLCNACSVFSTRGMMPIGLFVVPLLSWFALIVLVTIAAMVPGRPYSLCLVFVSIAALFLNPIDAGLLAIFFS
jgi:hypothetical protein